MPAPTDAANLSVRELAERMRPRLTSLNETFAYFSAPSLVSEEDLKEYLQEPLSALPATVVALLPKVNLHLVPYLERPATKERERSNGAGPRVTVSDRAPEQEEFVATEWASAEEASMFFAVKGRDVGDYHYRLYRALAGLVADRLPREAMGKFQGLLQEELNAAIHGEVDEESWRLKQGVQRRQGGTRRDTKSFVSYARQAFVDTLTLFLHGLCCDIDVETGPRQLPSRYLRKRLVLLQTLFPPSSGYALFPEELAEA